MIWKIELVFVLNYAFASWNSEYLKSTSAEKSDRYVEDEMFINHVGFFFIPMDF